MFADRLDGPAADERRGRLQHIPGLLDKAVEGRRRRTGFLDPVTEDGRLALTQQRAQRLAGAAGQGPVH